MDERDAPVSGSTGERLSAYERWTWARCHDVILALKNRLGYGERLWVLGFELLDDGRFVDPFHGVEVFDPTAAGPVVTIPSRYSAVPEMYCLLFTYAAAEAIPLSGQALSLMELDRVRRPKLEAADCDALLRYANRDLSSLQAVFPPFFGARVEGGDLAFEVRPLPSVPITLILWHGDEEMAASGTLLFDSSATAYLPGLLQELAWLTVWRLRNISDPKVKWGYHQLAAKGTAEG